MHYKYIYMNSVAEKEKLNLALTKLKKFKL